MSLLRNSTVGFIGIGTMGFHMAMNIMRGGYRLQVFDVNKKALVEAEKAGAIVVPTIADLVRTSDLVITMLPDAPDVEAVALGQDGIESAARSGTLYVDMSTIDPVTTRRVGARLAQRGIRMIDSPVARGVDNARAGTLALMVGGDVEVFKTVEPVLRLMADTITHCGGLGNGAAMKLVNNFMSNGIVSTIAESMTLGLKAGLPLDMMIHISGGTGTNNAWLHKLMPTKAFRGDYSLGFMSRLARKDQRLALKLADETGVQLTLGKAVLTMLDEAVAIYPQEDFTSVLRVVSGKAGVEMRLANDNKAKAS